MVVLLAGGTGGAKLARGLLDEADELVVIANTGDDVEIYNAHVSPDPDLVTFWLADRIDERGWGLAGDTFHVMDGLRELGEEVWFNLGDRDLAICLRRARRLAEGARLTEAIDEARRALGVRARVLPMCDEPVRTHVKARGRLASVPGVHDPRARGRPGRGRGAARHRGGAADARGARRARTRRRRRRRPVQPGDLDRPDPRGPGTARSAERAPVVAVSPLVRGQVLKGPTDVFMAWAGHPLSSEGIAAHYAGLIDGLVADEGADSVRTLVTDVEMGDPEARRRLAREVLAFAG